ncbi:hypothetical protein [Lutibacter citreus]|uniref:hypothetical protein n=1 Tax=Lutibacter citreus TaxID=2138210 RepID=UPI000DBE71F8|nr:hypothetical protein [Lutibacter citreus]
MIVFLNSILVFVLIYYVQKNVQELWCNAVSKNEKVFYIVFTLVHFAMSLAFVLLLDTLPNNDPEKYYNAAVAADNWWELFSVGGFVVSFLIYPLVKLKITIEVLFLLFATISFKGFLEYFKLISLEKIVKKKLLLGVFFLIPSIHFWTGFLGKEALLFLLMVFILKKVKHQFFDWVLVVCFALVFIIRPHVFFMLLLGLLVSILFDTNFSKKIKLKIVLIVSCITLVLIPVAFKYFLKIDTVNLAAIQEFFYGLAEHGEANGNSKIDILDTSIISRIFYLLFMPLPFLYSIKNSFQLVTSIENLYYVVICGLIIKKLIKNKFKISVLSFDHKFALLSSIFLIVLFGSYLYNLGLGNRMRIMFFPYIFYFLITYKKTRALNEKEIN